MPDARVELWRDPRMMQDVLTYTFTYTREQFHEMERDLVMSARNTVAQELSQLIYQRLGELGLRGATMAAWMEAGSGQARQYGLGLDMANPQHMVGLGLLVAAEYHRPTFVNLMDLDRGVEVRLECGYNNLEYTVNLYVHVRVPAHLAYRGGRSLSMGEAPIRGDRYRMGGSEVNLVQESMTLDLGGELRSMPRGPRRAEVSLNGVDVGSFTDLTVAANITGGEAVTLRDPAMVVAARENPERESIRNEARALTNQQQLRNQERILEQNNMRQQQVAAARAALDKPQGELKPRKAKRVSVGTETPPLEAESPRRLKLRRDRK